MKKMFATLAIAGLFTILAARCGANTIAEDFLNDPLQNGWKIFGDTNLFAWDSTNQNLDVTWDSTQPNSYFYKQLGTILAIDDDFSLSFDLNLTDVTGYNGSFELAVGLLHFVDATNADFSRGTGSSPNLFEFDYFPPDIYGDPYSIDATLKDPQAGFAGFYFAYDDLPLNPGVNYQVTLTHTANLPTISGEVLADGQFYTALTNTFVESITNFYLDTLSVSSFTDDGFGDSILAHGTVDNFVVSFPPLPVQSVSGGLTNGIWQAQFVSRSNWLYTLQRSADFQTWTNISSASGNGTNLFLQDTHLQAGNAFYRVKADRP